MRQFMYRLDTDRWSAVFTEAQVKDFNKCGLFGGRDLFELIPRTVKTVTTQEIV